MNRAKNFHLNSAMLILAAVSAPLAGVHAQAIGGLSLDYKVHPIRDGKLYWVEGGGGNSTVLIGDKGVILWDAKTDSETGKQLLKEVARLTPKPVTHVVETHSDCDHTSGLVAFPDSVRIIAHVNNAAEQDQLFQLATVEVDGGYGIPPKNRLPNSIIFKNKEAITLDKEHLVFYYVAPAHTNGDLITYLPEYKTVVAGDIFFMKPGFKGLPPQDQGALFKFEKDGSVEGWFKNVDFLLGLNADTYISGHGDALTKADVRKLYQEFRKKMGKVDALAESGKSLEQIKEALGDDKYPLAGLRLPGMSKECPRGIKVMPASEVRWHEWTRKHNELKHSR